MTTAAAQTAMLPYRRGADIDYASLEFNPDERNAPPDAMEQNLELAEIFGVLNAHIVDFNRRPDIFLDFETFICYDPTNLNVRISPDIYLAFGVDAAAIRPRKLYLPWEVGKPPDLAIEIASSSTGREDTNRKPAIYARVGVLEYWRFDPTGGRYHGARLYGGRLSNGGYQSVDLTTEPDGILKGYSAVLELSLCWDEGWPRFYNPATGTYLSGWRELWAAHAAAQSALQAERDAHAAAQAALQAAQFDLQSAQSANAATQSALQTSQDAHAAAVARLRELEAEVRRLRTEH